MTAPRQFCWALPPLFRGGAPQPPEGLAVPEKAEGYALWVDGARGRVYLVGRDDRGALFAAGRLLRLLHMDKESVKIDVTKRVATAPQYPIRGHQLGYRAANNTYDRWTLEQYEQYVRDLVVFGANCVELTAELDPQAEKNPHMPLSPWEMNARLSELFHSYGLDTWLWFGIDGDVSQPDEAEAELARQQRLFEHMPHLEAVFIPGGDPGDTPPHILMPYLERMAAVLRQAHPDAELWLSNQGFEHEYNDFLFQYLEEKRPSWLTGLVFGPWAKIGLPEMRRRTPAQYPIRRYPDICHCVRCQYPVSHWDRAFAHTLGREPYNPRPRDYAHIHNALAPHSVGFITYSDGVNDDVNKIVWTALGWDPEARVEDILAEYGRYYIDPDMAEEVAHGLLSLEDNWRERLLDNETVDVTLDHWKRLDDLAGKEAQNNWRFQLPLLRAHYDAYVRRRLVYETANEEAARAILREADEKGIVDAIGAAREALAEVDRSPESQALRRRIEELGAALFKSIGMQLDVERYGASGAERGAVLEFLDQPLNNRVWLEHELDAVLALDDSKEQRARIQAILAWEDPGPGGFYDDLGHAWKQPHLVSSKTWQDDPYFVEHPQNEFQGIFRTPGSDTHPRPLSTYDQAQTLYGTPLEMRYDDLDTDASYRLRVAYSGRFNATMSLTADGLPLESVPGGAPGAPVEYELPREATRDGALLLRWELVEGRGCQVAEVWLHRR